MQVTHYPETGGFDLRFVVHNKNYPDLSRIFYFDIINILYLVNSSDIIVNNNTTVTTPIEKAGDVGEAQIQMLFYHLFKDCGMPQYYLNMTMQLKIDNNIMQYSSTVHYDSPDFITALPVRLRPPKPIPISKMDIQIEFPGPCMGSVLISFLADDTQSVLSHREKMVTMVFKKMFSRLKEFIETMP